MKEISRKYISEIELLYLCNDKFKSDVKELRKKFDIKTFEKKDFDVDSYVDFDRKIISDNKLMRKYESELKLLATKHKATDYLSELESLVEGGVSSFDTQHLNKGVKLQGPIGNPTFKAREVDAPASLAGYKIEFKIKGPLLKSQLVKWAERHEDEIISISSDLFNGSKRSFKRIDSLDKLLKIIYYRDEMNFQFSDIANILCKQNHEDQDVVDGKVNEDSVRKLYNRYKNKYTL